MADRPEAGRSPPGEAPVRGRLDAVSPGYYADKALVLETSPLSIWTVPGYSGWLGHPFMNLAPCIRR